MFLMMSSSFENLFATPSPSPASSAQETRSYFVDAENMLEVARLVHQDRLFTSQMGTLFPERLDLSTVQTVLDIGCGPGGWVLDVAVSYPWMHLVGIDISPQMIKHARMLATAENVFNVEFVEMDAREPLRFSDASFDWINARFIHSFMRQEMWSPLLQECLRLLRPGGVLRLTELEGVFTNSVPIEKLNSYFGRAMYASGRGFSPVGRSSGITVVLKRFLADAGFHTLHHQAFGLDGSAQSQAAQRWKEDFLLLYYLLAPFLVATGVTTHQEMEELYAEAIHDLDEPTFCSMLYMLSVWGCKP